MRATDIVGGPFTPPGFYYKTFIRPRQAVAAVREDPAQRRRPRQAAPLPARARVAHRVPPPPRRRARHRRRDRPACTRRSPPPARRRRRARRRGRRSPVASSSWRASAQSIAALVERARGGRGRDPRPRLGARLLRRDGPGVAAATRCTRSARARHVFATGAIEQPLVFAGNDLPGVMLSGGARRLAALYAVSPGERAVIATTSDRGLRRGRGAARRRSSDRGRRRPAPGGRRARPARCAAPASRCSAATR